WRREPWIIEQLRHAIEQALHLPVVRPDGAGGEKPVGAAQRTGRKGRWRVRARRRRIDAGKQRTLKAALDACAHARYACDVHMRPWLVIGPQTGERGGGRVGA